MKQEKLFVVHWKTKNKQTGHGEPMPHSEAVAASIEGSGDYPNDDYWIEEAE